MKKSEFIKKVLKSRRNTVFVNKEQVENALEVFESFGMLPPCIGYDTVLQEGKHEWEPEDG